MSHRNISVNIKKITSLESKELIESIENHFQIYSIQTYQPVINRFTEITNDSKCLTNYVFESKYRCCKIIGIIEEDDSDEDNSDEDGDGDDDGDGDGDGDNSSNKSSSGNNKKKKEKTDNTFSNI